MPRIDITGIMQSANNDTAIVREVLSTPLGDGERIITVQPRKEQWEVTVTFNYTSMGCGKGSWTDTYPTREGASERAAREVSSASQIVALPQGHNHE